MSKHTKENWCVYVHTNLINNKKYIGITQDLKDRWRSNGKGYQEQVFYYAILKYGWDNFSHDILYDNLTRTEAQNKEIELIALCNTQNTKYGYNKTGGGEGRLGSTKKIYQYDMTGKFIKKWNGVKSVIEKNPTFSYNSITRCCNNPFKHKTHKNYLWSYSRLNKSEIKERLQNLESKKVYQYDLLGNFIKQWKNTNEPIKKGFVSSSICNCCNRKGEITHKNYIWSYVPLTKSEVIDILKQKNKRKLKNDKKIYQYDLKGQLLTIWYTSTHLVEEGYEPYKIYKSCRNEQGYNTYKESFWSYQKLKEEEISERISKIERNRCFYQYSLDKEFIHRWDNLNELKNQPFTMRSIYKCCNGERKSHKNFIWSYVEI